MSIKELPAFWLAVLTVVRELAPEAVLAGGAMRDLDNGAPVKDLDIFVQHTAAYGLPGNGLLAKLQRVDPFAYRQNIADFSSCLNDSDCVLSETFRVSGMDVNIVHLDGPVYMHRVLERIDFGICQIGYTPEQGVYSTDEYDTDKADRTFTITRRDSDNDLARTLRRWDRLSEKYPGWSLINTFKEPPCAPVSAAS